MTAKPLVFFALVFALSVPFYLLGAAGGRLFGLAILPASALMVVTPITAALVLVYRQRGIVGIATLFKRALDLSRQGGAGWHLTALLFMPIVCVLQFGALRLMGGAVPLPQIGLGEVLFLFVAFFIGAIGEEVGWQGYAYPALRTRLNAAGAAIVLGLVWGLWHIIPFAQQGRSTDWILWQGLSSVAMRIIIVWLYENTGQSLFIAVLFHTMINVSWALFPNAGSFYNPFVTFLILMVVIGFILVFFEPGKLTRRGPRTSDRETDRQEE